MKGSQLDALTRFVANRPACRVQRLVAGRAPTSATRSERELPVTPQAIVKHLVVLRQSRHRQRIGHEVRYALVQEPLDDVSDWIVESGSRWGDRQARLRQVVLDQNFMGS